MPNRIRDKDLPVAIVNHLAVLGWNYDEQRGQWWKTYQDGSVWSSNSEDHVREFPSALAAAALVVNGAPAEESLAALKGAPLTTDLVKPAGDNMRSEQVSEHDDNFAPAPRPGDADYVAPKPEDSFDHQVRQQTGSLDQQQDQQQQ